MEVENALKALLNLQLASDSSAVLNLPYVLDVLSNEHFLPSSHLSKWTARLNSLLHSKDAGARWAGLCLAHRTSICSKSVMIECAQSWLGVAIPILSKKESTPVLKAALNLCRIVFTNATDTPEFQRQVSTPNVPKFTAAMIVFLEKDFDTELKALALTTLSRLVPFYPNIYRASYAPLTSIVSRIRESPPGHIEPALIGPASKLYSVLHFTGGKVGAASLWRKSLDESVDSVRNYFYALRTTFPDEYGHFPPTRPLHDDPATSFALNLERLHTSVLVLSDLLRTTTQRPVQIPIGPLAKLATAMITVIQEDTKVDGYVDPSVRAMEMSIIPAIWKLACNLISCLAKCVDRHLSPYLARICSYIAFHLEQKLPSAQRLPFLETLYTLLKYCHPLHSTILASRLTRVILSSISSVLPSQADVQSHTNHNTTAHQSRKGKKKARTYEGDELFRTSWEVICPTKDDGKALLVACDIMQLLLRNPDVTPAVHSLASRVLLAILLSLPALTPSTLSPDPQVYAALVHKVRKMTIEIGAGTTSAMSKSLGLVIGAVYNTNSDEASLRELDLLLHPRLPPVLRSLPQVELLSLFRAEESMEERHTREDLSLGTTFPEPVPVHQEDAVMTEAAPQAKAPQLSEVSVLPRLLPSLSATPSAEQSASAEAPVKNSDKAKEVFEQTVQAAPALTPAERTDSPILPSYIAKGAPPVGRSEQSQRVNPVSSEVVDVDEEMPSIDVNSDSDSD